jgi:hypothetical protein
MQVEGTCSHDQRQMAKEGKCRVRVGPKRHQRMLRRQPYNRRTKDCSRQDEVIIPRPVGERPGHSGLHHETIFACLEFDSSQAMLQSQKGFRWKHVSILLVRCLS